MRCVARSHKPLLVAKEVGIFDKLQELALLKQHVEVSEVVA